MIPASGTERNRLFATITGLTLGGLAYFLTLLDYRPSLTRTTLQSGLFSTFYDQQARAFLDGHVDLPANSLGIEGFVHDGRTFMYFPPWPAILRLPVLLTTHEYDGRLTLLSMTIAWIVFAVMVTKLVWLLVPRLSGFEDVNVGTAAVVALFLAAATGGTFLTFDAAQPWVYTEAYLWAVAAAMGGLYWLVRLIADPTRHATWWLFVFALVSVGTRATEGWALCARCDRARPVLAVPAPAAGAEPALVAGGAGGSRPAGALDRPERVQVRQRLHLPAAGPGLDLAQRAPT